MDKSLGNKSLQLDEKGNVHFTYHQYNDGINELWYNQRTADGELETAIQINDPAESLYSANIVVVNSNNVFLSYTKEVGGANQIFLRQIVDGEENEYQITNSLNGIFTPHLAEDDFGIIHLTWVDLDEEDSYKIFYTNSKFITDENLTEPKIEYLLFSNVGDPSKSLPNISLTDAGLPHIIYVGPSGSGTKVQYGYKTSENGNWINSFISQSPNKFDFIAKMKIENGLVHAVYTGNDSIGSDNKVIYTTKEINESNWGSYTVVAWEEGIKIESFSVEKDIIHLAMLNKDDAFVYANNKEGAWENNTILGNYILTQIEMTIDDAGNGLIIANTPTAQAPQIILWGAQKTFVEQTDTAINLSIQTINDPLILVYPNPSSDYIKIESTELNQFQAFDMMGKMILQDEISNTQKIEVADWPKGNYIIRLFDNEKQVLRKIVVQ